MNSPNPTGDMADEVKLLTWTQILGEAVAWRLVISGDISPFFLLLSSCCLLLSRMMENFRSSSSSAKADEDFDEFLVTGTEHTPYCRNLAQSAFICLGFMPQT
ncbi:hypothetical protein CDAR_452391 [Caerostris darwini]|uniref:Uncharacterized protein n=1 Tax=Caerostris darwini TaxID=1538125 RepID=A0AAV4VQG0_9ARAC|nr:hypothetical protein CDAR_452391 [Caerostris darwini]